MGGGGGPRPLISKEFLPSFLLQIYFVDIGANIGTYTIAVAAAGFSVLSFEPMRINQNAVRLSLCANPDAMQRVTFFNSGLGSAASRCEIWTDPTNFLNGVTVCDSEGSKPQYGTFFKRQDIETQRLDDLLQDWIEHLKGKVGALKIDTEGFEPLVRFAWRQHSLLGIACMSSVADRDELLPGILRGQLAVVLLCVRCIGSISRAQCMAAGPTAVHWLADSPLPCSRHLQIFQGAARFMTEVRPLFLQTEINSDAMQPMTNYTGMQYIRQLQSYGYHARQGIDQPILGYKRLKHLVKKYPIFNLIFTAVPPPS